jgi:hypothetical protein
LKWTLSNFLRKWVKKTFIFFAHTSFCKGRASFHALNQGFWMFTIWRRFCKASHLK